MSYLIVPSDITVLESKVSVGQRRVSFLESIGLMGMFPMYHNSFSKMSKHEMRDVLTKKYPDTNSEEVEICKTRQLAVHRQVVSHIGFWGGLGGMGFGTFWSFRKYNYQSKLVLIPFLGYAGACIGRAVGDVVTGKNGATYRETFLGSLPARVYYGGGE